MSKAGLEDWKGPQKVILWLVSSSVQLLNASYNCSSNLLRVCVLMC